MLLSDIFHPTVYHSFDRAIVFIALDSASAVYWQYRSEVDDATLLPQAYQAISPHEPTPTSSPPFDTLPKSSMRL